MDYPALSAEVLALNALLDGYHFEMTNEMIESDTVNSVVEDAQRALFQLITLRILFPHFVHHARPPINQDQVVDALSSAFKKISTSNAKSPVLQLLNPIKTHFSKNSIQTAWEFLYNYKQEKTSKKQVKLKIIDCFSSVLSNIIGFLPTIVVAGNKGFIEFKSSNTSKRETGTYYTPSDLAKKITKLSIDETLLGRFQDANIPISKLTKKSLTNLSEIHKKKVRDILLNTTILDPACGTGNILIPSAEQLAGYLNAVTDKIGNLHSNSEFSIQVIVSKCIYGVDKNPLALLLTEVSLWLISGQNPPDNHFKCGDSILGSVNFKQDGFKPPIELELWDKPIYWDQEFPMEMHSGGFSVVVTNPPWERLKVMGREFFLEHGLGNIETTSSRNEVLRSSGRKLIDKFDKTTERIKKTTEYIKKSDEYPLTSKSDLNLYKLFAERAYNLTSQYGTCGLIIPTGMITDYSSKAFMSTMLREGRILSVYDFENRKNIFPSVDGRFRFCLMLIKKVGGITDPKFAFFLHSVSELNSRNRSFRMNFEQISFINPIVMSPPIVRSSPDLRLLEKLSRAQPFFIDLLNEWGVRYIRMVDMSNDSHSFHKLDLKHNRGTQFPIQENQKMLMLYEGKMISAYNHRYASAVTRDHNSHRPGGSVYSDLDQLRDPSFKVTPRFYVPENLVKDKIRNYGHSWFIGYKDITSATNERTMIATVLPHTAVGNKIPILLTNKTAREAACLLANLNSFVFDFIARNKIGNITLNWYIVKQTNLCPPDLYQKIYLDGQLLLDWISKRVAELTFTSHDLEKWGEDLGFAREPYIWNEDRRRSILIELDALFLILYGLNVRDVRRILSAFPIVKRKEIKRFGFFKLEGEIVDQMKLIGKIIRNQLDNANTIEFSK